MSETITRARRRAASSVSMRPLRGAAVTSRAGVTRSGPGVGASDEGLAGTEGPDTGAAAGIGRGADAGAGARAATGVGVGALGATAAGARCAAGAGAVGAVGAG